MSEYTREYLNTLCLCQLEQILIKQRKPLKVSSGFYKAEYIDRILGIRLLHGEYYDRNGKLRNRYIFTLQ